MTDKTLNQRKDCTTCGKDKCNPDTNYIDRHECDNWTHKTDKALIEKAFKFWWSSRYLNSQHIRQAKNAFIASANWQREQIIKELREWADKNKFVATQGIAEGLVVPADDLLAKLDLLEGEK